MPNRYADLSVNDFDNYDCVKLSKGVYLLLAFVLRGYVVWLISVTNMRDRVAIMEWLFPQTAMFYLSLVSGAFGLFILLIISLRRPGAANWVRWCWAHCRSFLILALLFDLAVTAAGYFHWQLLSWHWLAAQAIIVSGFIYFCFSNRKFQLNLQEFPEALPDK